VNPKMIEELKKDLVEKKALAATAAAEAKRLEQILALMAGETILIGDDPLKADDFKGLGIVDAAKRFLKEAGEPKTTNEIAEELLRRGLETKSKRWVPTLYSTLDNASSEVKRIGHGRKGKWALKETSR
jgi:hypothetical protein